MGRAGRGGGGSRGGGFGGSRGFGSHSGGGFGHRSSFHSSHSSSHSSHSSSHSSHSSSHHSYHSTGPRFSFYGSSSLFGNSSGSAYSSGNTASKVVERVVLKSCFFMGLIFVMAIYCFITSSDDIQKSTIEREKLESSSLVVSDTYYDDELNWIKSKSSLEKGMRAFFEKTGVQPYLKITDTVVEGKGSSFTNEEFNAYANDLYDKLFNDEAHMLVVFFEYNGKYRSCYVTGLEAKTVIDDEAGEILLDYIDHYYYSDMDEDEFFSRSFEDAGTRIMRVTPSYGWIALIVVLFLVLLIVVFRIWKKRKKLRLDEMEKAKQILDSDLNEFGTAGYNAAGQNASASSAAGGFDSSEVDELKKKYDGL